MPFIIDPNGPHFDDQGRPIIIPPPGMEHEDLINIPGQMPGFENTPVKAPTGAVPQSQNLPMIGAMQDQPPVIPPTQTPLQTEQSEVEQRLQKPVNVSPPGQQILPTAPTVTDIAEQQYESQFPNPNDPKFYQSKGRRVLDAIATGLATAVKGPVAGQRISDMLNPYERALRKWEERGAPLKTAVARQTRQFEEGKAEAQARVQQQDVLLKSLNIQSENDRALLQRLLEERRLMTEQNKLAEETRNHDLEHADRVAANNKLSPEEREFLRTKLMTPDEYKEWAKFRRDFKGELSDDEKFALYMRERDYTQKLRKEFEGSPEHLKAQREGATARAEGTEEGKSHLTESDRQTVDAVTGSILKDPVSYTGSMKQITNPKVRAAIITRLSNSLPSIPRTLTPQEENTAKGARATIAHLNSVQPLIDDPDIQEFIGPVVGRATKGLATLGSIPGATPEQEKKLQKVLTLLNQTGAWEASSQGGGRPAFRFIEYLTKGMPDLSKDPNLIQGAIDGMMTSEGDLIRAIYGGDSAGQGSVSNIKVGPPR